MFIYNTIPTSSYVRVWTSRVTPLGSGYYIAEEGGAPIRCNKTYETEREAMDAGLDNLAELAEKITEYIKDVRDRR